MKQRTITAFVFAAIMLGGIYWSRYSFQILFTLIATGMLWELLGLLIPPDDPHRRFRRALGSLIGIAPVCWMGFAVFGGFCCGLNLGELQKNQEQTEVYWIGIPLVFTGLFAMLAFLHELFRQSSSPASTVGHYLLGLFYIGLPIIFLFILVMPGATFMPNRAFGLLWLIWTNDTVAYLVGSRFGKTKLLESISPKKTWEGTLGGIIGAIAMAWVLALWMPDYKPAQWLALGAIVGVFGTFGDLVESMLKRHAGVKDSGALLPGHGGLLDRFDSFIFVLPFAWLAVMLLGA